MKTTINIAGLLIVIFAVSGFLRMSEDTVWVGRFSEMNTELEKPQDWEILDFRGIFRSITQTDYDLVELDGRIVVKAESDESASGLIKRVDVDLQEHPYLNWSWNIQNLIEASDISSKDGDDYPARIYVVFDYDRDELSYYQRNKIRILERVYGEVPARAINYFHAKEAEIDRVFDNPYTDLSKMVPVDNGGENVGSWQQFSRNVYEDYRRIYNEEPPNIKAVAIMTDTDDTGEQATAYFGDISFTPQPPATALRQQ